MLKNRVLQESLTEMNKSIGIHFTKMNNPNLEVF